MNSDYISIKEFAELAGVSQQSIYQRIKKPHNPIQVYLKEVNNKTLIRKTALKDLYSNDNKQQEHTSPIERVLDILENQLVEKDRQLKEKDKQIESLLKSMEDTQKLLDHQQQLKAMETKLLIGKRETAENKEQKQEEKRGFFSRFFS